MARPVLHAHLALLGVALIYGANYSIAKVVLDDAYIGPRGFILMRVLTATGLFWLLFRRSGPAAPPRADLWRLVLCGFLGVSLNQLLFFDGLARTSPIHASLIMVLTPLMVLLIGAVAARRWPGPRVSAGVLLAGGGAVWLMMPRGAYGLGTGDLTGDLMVAGNATSYALYLVLVQPLMMRYPPMWVLKWVFLFGTFFVLFAGWDQMLTARWTDFTLPVALSFGYVLLFTTFFTYLLNAFALQHVAAVTVSAYIYLQPVIAAAVALGMGKDRLTVSTLAAGLTIVGGVWLASRRARSAGG